jgi:SAM-dependent methyltransferase
MIDSMGEFDMGGLIGTVVADGGLDGLARVTATINGLEQARTDLINDLRRVPTARWEEIGRACGMTRQGAQRRWARNVQAASFGVAAVSYERSRPGYPAMALDWLLPPGARRVLDLGAGTGQLTRLLVARGLEVTAVEPSSKMREQLAHSTVDATVLAGSAENIPVPGASMDTVLVAQAWHWVDHQRGIPEVARVLIPGGRIGLLWNVRDERVPWVARLGAIMYQYTRQEGNTTPTVFAPFENIEHYEVSWTYRLSPAQLVELVASRSYVITLPDHQRQDLLADVAEFLAAEPALAGKPYVDLPYVTQCTRARLSLG